MHAFVIAIGKMRYQLVIVLKNFFQIQIWGGKTWGEVLQCNGLPIG